MRPRHVALVADVLNDGVQAARLVANIPIDGQHRMLCSEANVLLED